MFALRAGLRHVYALARHLFPTQWPRGAMVALAFLQRLGDIAHIGVYAGMGLFAVLLAKEFVFLAMADMPTQPKHNLLFQTFLTSSVLALLSWFGTKWSFAHVADAWRRSSPQDFQRAWHLWATSVVAHHALSLTAHTPLCINPRTLAILGHPTPPVSRAVRRHMWRHTTNSLNLSLWECLMLGHALQLCWDSNAHLPYIPPSAHAIMAAQRAVLRARVTQHRPLRLLSTHTM